MPARVLLLCGSLCLPGMPLAQAPAAETTGQTPTGERPEPAGPGFRVEIQGMPAGMDRAAFGDAVLAALPPALLDPGRNFTRSDAFRTGEAYRMLLVFHSPETGDQGGAARSAGTTDLTTLCRREEGPPLPEAPPPAFADLTASTTVSAAFCRGTDTLSTAEDRLTGEVRPDMAGFRFLVGDVAKQLFPGGFDRLPDSIPSPPAAPVAGGGG
ncbi:MAG: hypothetical protein RLY86_469 [Pseudomonadota bacterium]|jgi:hypothetical protein